MRAAGDFVVAWESNCQDGSDYGVFARRFNATGVPQASEFQVNAYTATTRAIRPSASTARATSSWRGPASAGWLGDGVFARRFNAAGTPQASEFRVNSHTLELSELSRRGAWMTGGDFVVAWQS